MKKTSLFLVLPLLLATVSPSFAVNQELKDKKVEVKTARTTAVQERKQIKLETKITRAQASMNRLRQGIISRYENVLKQKASIEARITKIESAVVPTGKTARDLTLAKAKLAEFSSEKYTANLTTFDAKAAEVLASTTPLKLTPELKTLAKTLDVDIKTMRTTLADTLRLIIKAR